ncbi:MAG: Uma2 family endonuclease [Candidatus Kapaibacterium sp.]|nr:MAG: Uma2 family endonuclease [Candidatus Kapabacteria bacterium]
MFPNTSIDALLETERRVVRSGATVEEYFALEEEHHEKYEFHNGEILSMPGGTYEHSSLTARVIGLLYKHLASNVQTEEIIVLSSDMRVNIPTYNRYVYPDITIVRGEPHFADAKRTQLLNPTVIIEVLSDSTADYDRSDKFEYYRSIPSLEEVAFFAQDRAHAELFRKNAHGRWEIVEIENSIVEFASVQAHISLAEIYPQNR